MATLAWKTQTVRSHTTAGVLQALSVTSVLARSLVLTADAANTNNVYLLEAGKLAADGHPLAPGGVLILEVPNDSLSNDRDSIDLSAIQMDADLAGNKIRISYLAY